MNKRRGEKGECEMELRKECQVIRELWIFFHLNYKLQLGEDMGWVLNSLSLLVHSHRSLDRDCISALYYLVTIPMLIAAVLCSIYVCR